ncbi:unnamed protein product [Miscanthus lutarioriparius]|uniref:WRC domain-containing protein n=1 Tax=Miscanthus lutarioriparius TaxID=422564 RepID=A0A811SEN5_9POAL|nr:unnamed protein product [Miscanthus lutarioriparius]
MRIRRRPQPSSLQAAAGSDLAAASTAPQTPLNAAARNRGGWLLAAGGEDEDREAKLLHANSADLVLGQKSGVARRLALPLQDDNVVVDCGRSSMGGAQRGGADDDDGRMRFSAANGHGGSEHKDGGATCTGVVGARYEPAVVVKAEERVTSNGFVQQPAVASVTAAVVKQDEGKKQQATGNGTGGAKKRRGPAVLLEGSRCSRVNGRGWRCSQPTLVGYSLCEHHLGKGRMRSAAAAARGGGGAGAGVGRLGRTEHGARIAAAVGAGVVAAAAPPPKAEGPSLPGC